MIKALTSKKINENFLFFFNVGQCNITVVDDPRGKNTRFIDPDIIPPVESNRMRNDISV